MSRALPLSTVSQPDSATHEPVVATADVMSGTLSGTVAVFDPAMCCPTGLCGPGVDPALLTISRDLRWLEKQGATVSRAGLSTAPDAFVANPRVQGLLQAFGDGALPATLINGNVLVYGRYPSRDELVAALASAVPNNSATPIMSSRTLASLPLASDTDTCAPGSGCC